MKMLSAGSGIPGDLFKVMPSLVLGLEGGLVCAKLLPTALHSTMKPGLHFRLLCRQGHGLRMGPGAEILPNERRQWFAFEKEKCPQHLQVKWVSAEHEASEVRATASPRLYIDSWWLPFSKESINQSPNQ